MWKKRLSGTVCICHWNCASCKRKLEQETRETLLNVEDLSAKSVFDAVKADDAVAKEIAQDFGSYLGRALSNLAVVIDPSVFVIGGGVSKAGEILLEVLWKNHSRRAHSLRTKK